MAVGIWRASGPDSTTPSTTNAAPGLTSSSCWPAGSVTGSVRHGLAGNIAEWTADPCHFVGGVEHVARGRAFYERVSDPEIRCGGGPAVLGNPAFWVEVRDGLPAGRATIFLGAEPTVNYAAGGVALLLVPLYLEVAHLDHSGAHRWSVPIGSDPALVGEWGYAQVWIGDPWAPNPALLAATRRLAVRVGERW